VFAERAARLVERKVRDSVSHNRVAAAHFLMRPASSKIPHASTSPVGRRRTIEFADATGNISVPVRSTPASQDDFAIRLRRNNAGITTAMAEATRPLIFTDRDWF